MWWKREAIEPVVLCAGALEGQFAMASSLAAWYCSWVVVEDEYRLELGIHRRNGGAKWGNSRRVMCRGESTNENTGKLDEAGRR